MPSIIRHTVYSIPYSHYYLLKRQFHLPLFRRGRFEARRGLELIAGALIKKLHVLRIETKPEMAKLPVLVLCNVECAIARWDIIVFEVQEHDDICILLYLPGFSQARQRRRAPAALFGTAELRERNYRYPSIPAQLLFSYLSRPDELSSCR